MQPFRGKENKSIVLNTLSAAALPNESRVSRFISVQLEMWWVKVCVRERVCFRENEIKNRVFQTKVLPKMK